MNEINITGWSLSSLSKSKLVRPKNIEELFQVFDYASTNGLSICPMGAGNSYGDIFQNKSNLVIDLNDFNKILSWNTDTGIIIVEPGVTIKMILETVLPDNWVLPVCPGTRNPTIGGALSNNIHGKNSYQVGNFGDSTIEFDVCLADKKIVTCSRDKNSDLFFSVIGGIGLLGVIIKVKLQLKKIPSPYLSVKKWTTHDLQTMISNILEASNNFDHVIGQIDGFSTKNKLGRGTIHAATYTNYANNENVFTYDLNIPKKIFSVLSPDVFIKLGQVFINSFSINRISSLKYYLDSKSNQDEQHIQSFPKFNFLLDRIPNWPRIFKYGFYEFEPLLPLDNAEIVIREILDLSHKYKMPPYLIGIKLHRKDDFLLSYALDGLSIGLDYPVLPSRKHEQADFFSALHEIIISNNGLIYLAKDDLCKHEQFKRIYGDRIDRFMEIKKNYDPAGLFQSNMYRRLFINV